jgi:hypothetical protein
MPYNVYCVRQMMKHIAQVQIIEAFNGKEAVQKISEDREKLESL